MTVLIVEDEDSIQIIWKHFLRGLPVDVICVKTLGAAFQEMKKIPPPDLILLDLHLLDSTAEHTVKSIREFSAINPGSVIMVLTGDTDAKLRQAATALGADFYTVKTEIQSQVALYRAMESAITQPNKNRSAPPFEDSVQLLEKITQLCVDHADKKNKVATLQNESLTAPHPGTLPFRMREL